MEFIDLKTQYRNIKESVDRRIHAVLEHGQYVMGPEISQLEEALAARTGAKHCIACSSGTDALLLGMLAFGIGRGDEVVTTPFSFFATAEIITLLGATPVFVDIDPSTYNLDAKRLSHAITTQTKAILPVSLYGQCADMDAIVETAGDIPVIEDAAQSFGATYKARQSCNLSLVGCTSFFPSKPLGCYGEGGACFTSDDELAERMRMVRNHGQDRRYHHPMIGVNARMDSIQAAVLLAKLEVFDTEVQRRADVGARYGELLQGIVKTPEIMEGSASVYAQYTIEVEDRDAFQEEMKRRGVPTAVHYPEALHLQPAYSSLGYREGDFPVAEAAAKHVVSLPMHPYLSDEDLVSVAKMVAESIETLRKHSAATRPELIAG
ncbi:UDP-4-amino-4-deoxy-L-arabinose--oxoglutarate aminotransferase [Acidisarcina polymorpha]|uniref:UDP-4-amino-4-deoxy-L-arabinose--oxoglutarate aminotransferase n=1 Tax=Acidisarcina polymorpha TaxID=2211140 RepID=A0A2Z5FXX3_9BACT|nr:DegT/DnrJ/EryC1/StrS family aminotransferase [Acidisarcina polymorpha]AXC11739.1 UDP-4-amino-4-deoxy-L-arabinose--oxoglutarate aminotransferase [Acidisarcina polymorpha]